MSDNLGPFAGVALRLHEMGLAPIPCGGAEGKTPLIGSWQQRRLSAERIARLAEKFPGANVGIVCGLSRIVIVDVDRADRLKAMLQRFGDTPLITRTGRGYHLWYREGAPIKPTQLKGLGVDILAGPRFAVVPPSRHAGGTRYAFERGGWDDLGRLPEFRADALDTRPSRTRPRKTPPSTGAVIREGRREPGFVHEGARNDTLFATCLRLAKEARTLEELLAWAHASNRERNRPPLPDSEVEQTARSAWRYQCEDRNWVGSSGFIQLDVDLILRLAGPHGRGGDALFLCMHLVRAHAYRTGPFAVAPRAMARAGCIPGWSEHRYRRAREAACAAGLLVRVRQGGRGPGHVALYELGTAGLRTLAMPMSAAPSASDTVSVWLRTVSARLRSLGGGAIAA